MEDKMERRSFMRGAGAIVEATAAVALDKTRAHAQAAPAGSKSVNYEPKPLSLDISTVWAEAEPHAARSPMRFPKISARRSLAGGILGHGQGRGRRIGLGHPR